MGLGSALAGGLAFGAGAGLAHGAVSNLMGGGRGGRADEGGMAPYTSEGALYGQEPMQTAPAMTPE
jgi:hypothetical protein